MHGTKTGVTETTACLCRIKCRDTLPLVHLVQQLRHLRTITPVFSHALPVQVQANAVDTSATGTKLITKIAIRIMSIKRDESED